MKKLFPAIFLLALVSGCAHGEKKEKTPEHLAKKEKRAAVFRQIVGAVGTGMTTAGEAMAPAPQTRLTCDPEANLDGTHNCWIQN